MDGCPALSWSMHHKPPNNASFPVCHFQPLSLSPPKGYTNKKHLTHHFHSTANKLLEKSKGKKQEKKRENDKGGGQSVTSNQPKKLFWVGVLRSPWLMPRPANPLWAGPSISRTGLGNSLSSPSVAAPEELTPSTVSSGLLMSW